jgi:hypothetical protein
VSAARCSVVFVFLVACGAATSPYLGSGFSAPRELADRASIEFIRPSKQEATTLAIVTETDGRFVAHIPAESRTRAYVAPGRRLLFVAGQQGDRFTRAMPLWIDVRAGKTYLVHVEVLLDAEMDPIPVRPDRVRQWQYFRAWRDETRLYAVTKQPEAPVVSPEVCKAWYAGYRELWEGSMDDAEKLAHTLLPEDGK